MANVPVDECNNVLRGVLGYGYYNATTPERHCDYTKPEKLQDYFYKIEYEDYDYAEGYQYMKNWGPNESNFNSASGMVSSNFGCSCMRKDNYVVRSFDWLYNQSPTFFIKTKATKGKFATIGTTFTLSDVTAAMIDAGEELEVYKYLPFLTVDVINENGVYINNNVVTAGEKGKVTNQNTGKQRICQLMLIRYIGDYAKSAKHAVELFKGVDAFAPANKIGYEAHFALCDKDNSYIIEYINNNLKVMSNTDEEYEPIPNDIMIMTNFYIDGWNGQIKAVYKGDSKEEVRMTGLTPYSCGLERYDLLYNGYRNLNTLENYKKMLYNIRYTKTYLSETQPHWYSEYVGNGAFGDLSIYSTEEDFRLIDEKGQQLYREGKRDGSYWISRHSCVYNLDKKVMYICVDEMYDKWYKFKIDSIDDGSNLEDLDDVEFTDLEKDDFISYDSRDGKWKNVDFPLEMKTDDEEETLVLNINVFND